MQNYPIAPNNYTVPNTSIPGAAASGVNIVIYSPSVMPGNASVANSYNMAPAGTPVNSYPQNYYTQPQNIYQPNVSNQYPNSQAATPIAAEPVAEPAPKDDENKKTREITQLSDEYIKTLENYIKNKNPQIRISGAKELMNRFEEEPSRKNDAALNSLLNVALQDTSKEVRFIALAILDSNWATGDDLTVELLKKMQSSTAVYGEDATFASEVLLKLSGNKVTVPDLRPDKPASENKKKTNEVKK